MLEQIYELLQSQTVREWTLAIGVSLGSFLALFTIKAILWRRLHRWSERTHTQWDDLIVKRLKSPIRLLIVIASLSMGLQFTSADIRNHALSSQGLRVVLVLIALWTVDRLYSFVIRKGQFKINISDSSRSLLVLATRVGVYSIALLIILDTLGISITPVLASLGVGSLAVALALQDTLNNFFSGLYILLDKPIRVGDFVELEENVKGVVEKVGWRSTHIKMLSNNTIVVPNSKVSAATLTNYNMPSEEMSLLVQGGVSYASDLEKVEHVVIGVARYILENRDGGVTGFDPVLRFHTFNNSSIDFTVVLRVKNYLDKFLIQHEFIKALHKKFEEENIEIPFPQRVVHMIPQNQSEA